jgi:hypothetical protein
MAAYHWHNALVEGFTPVTRHHPMPPDPTEPVLLVDTHGVQHGPYPRCFAEGLRRCFTIAGDFALAELVPTGEPGLRATRVHGTWVQRP